MRKRIAFLPVLLMGMAWVAISVDGADLSSTGKVKNPTIAVSPLEGRGLAEGEASTLTDALASHLTNTGKFRVMERGKMDVVLKEQGFQQSGACTDEACIVEMGQLLGVDNIVTGSIGKVGKTYSVSVRMINVASGEIVRNVSKYFKGEIDGLLIDVMPAIADDFAGVKPESVPVVEKTPAPEPAPAPAVSTATAPAPPKEPAPKSKSNEVKPKKSGHPVLLAVVGVLLVGGGVAAFLYLNNQTDADETETASVEVTWTP